MEKILVFDMDGTIADLYGVENWLDDLINKNVRPYREAKPLVEMEMLVDLLEIFKSFGWKIAVTSWLAKNSNADYDKRVAKVKIDWLKEYNFPVDIVNIVTYGTLKTICTKKFGGFQVLIDDEKQNRDNWDLGATINPTENLINALVELLVNDIG